jgi:hypothetical protein
MSQSTLVDDAPAPAEVLIREAKDRQRQRYRRSALWAGLVALVVGGLIALLVTTTSSGSGTLRAASRPSVVVAGRGPVLIRPVLCFAYPYAANASRQAGTLPSCGAPYELTESALDIMPMSDPQGYSSNNILPDPSLAGYPSSTRDVPGHDALLGAFGHRTGAERYLLGPSELKLSAANVRSIAARQDHLGAWIVTIHLSSAGAAIWDRVVQENFHQLLAIDMGGKVVSAPVIEPAQSSYTSFKGEMQVSGSLTGSEARAVAAAVKG